MRIEKTWAIPAFVGISALASGFIAGFIVGQRKGRGERKATIHRIDKYMQQELDFGPRKSYKRSTRAIRSGMEDHPANLNHENFRDVDRLPEDLDEEDEDQTPEEILEEYRKENNMNNPSYLTESPNWSYETEMANRTPFKPHVIHFQEFHDNEYDLTQTTLEYYQKDDILTDEHDDIIYNVEELVGELKFGHGSMDRNVFYVRNPKLMIEFEIVLNFGSYREEVLGQAEADRYPPDELKHSNRKFKME
jgi:hypothetical protein